MKSVIIGRNLYAVAIALFGIQQCITGDLVAGRPFAGESATYNVVAYATGIILVLTGVAIVSGMKNQWALIISGLYLLGWCAIRNLIGTIDRMDNGYLLTCTGKALVLGSGAFLVLKTFGDKIAPGRPEAYFQKMQVLCRYSMGIFLLISGIQHFLFADFVRFLIPAWIPWPVFWVYASACLLIAVGVLLLIGWKIRMIALSMCAVLVVWLFVVHLPRVFNEKAMQQELTSVGEVLAFIGLLGLMALQDKRRE